MESSPPSPQGGPFFTHSKSLCERYFVNAALEKSIRLSFLVLLLVARVAVHRIQTVTASKQGAADGSCSGCECCGRFCVSYMNQHRPNLDETKIQKSPYPWDSMVPSEKKSVARQSPELRKRSQLAVSSDSYGERGTFH